MLGGVAAYLDHDWSLLKCHCRPLVAVPARWPKPRPWVDEVPLQTADCGPGNPRACL